MRADPYSWIPAAEERSMARRPFPRRTNATAARAASASGSSNSEYAGTWISLTPSNHASRRSSGRRPVLAPRWVAIVLSPFGPTRTAITPVGCAAQIACTSTPSVSISATSRWPPSSSPTLVISPEGSPTLAAQAQKLAAWPPPHIVMRAGLSQAALSHLGGRGPEVGRLPAAAHRDARGVVVVGPQPPLGDDRDVEDQVADRQHHQGTRIAIAQLEDHECRKRFAETRSAR